MFFIILTGKLFKLLIICKFKIQVGKNANNYLNLLMCLPAYNTRTLILKKMTRFSTLKNCFFLSKRN